MKLSRRQQIALKYLSQSKFPQPWWAINSAMQLCGDTHCNGFVTANSLITKGMAIFNGREFFITDNGREVAKTISVTVQIEQVKP